MFEITSDQLIPTDIANDSFLKVKEFIEDGRDVNFKFDDGETLLIKAITFEARKIIEYLFENNVDKNKAGNDKWLPIHYACRRGSSLDIIDQLIDSDNINVQTVQGNTPLLISLQHKRPILAKHLLTKDLDINICNNEQAQAIHWAAKLGYTEMFNNLVAKGANINADDKRTPSPSPDISNSNVESHVGKKQRTGGF